MAQYDDYEERPRRRKPKGKRKRARKKSGSNKTVIIIVIAAVCLGMFVVCGGIGMALLLPAVQQARTAARRTQSKNNLKMLGLAMHNYHDVHRTFPAGAYVDENGVARHGWTYSILPFVESAPLFNNIDPNKPWNDPANQTAYQTPIPNFVNPGIAEAPVAGFPVIHYAGNSHIFGPNQAIQFRDIRDGTSNTILIGEVNNSFKAWGDPTNVRDPQTGLGNRPDQFGGPWIDGGAQMLFCDGAVHFISGKISPDVLKKLATPAGGENIGDF